jgi:hypothetical protein
VTSSLWHAVEREVAGGVRLEVIEPRGATRRSGAALPRYFRTLGRRPEHAWLLPLYPYLVLLDFFRPHGHNQPTTLPTKTYTLY